jgi:hypothetical protein
MEIRSVVADLILGQLEGRTEGQRNVMKLQQTYRNYSNAPLRDDYQFSHGVGAFLTCIVRQT